MEGIWKEMVVVSFVVLSVCLETKKTLVSILCVLAGI
jgi:hypothetical protein